MIRSLARFLARFLVARSRRERLLLALALLVAVPLALLWLVALPLGEQRAAARTQLRAAQAERDWYAARLPEIAALPVAHSVAHAVAQPARAVVGLAGIEARLIDAGLRPAVAQLENAPNDGVSLRFRAVDFVDLMQWLDAIEGDAGYRVAALQISATDQPALVDADLRLEPAP